VRWVYVLKYKIHPLCSLVPQAASQPVDFHDPLYNIDWHIQLCIAYKTLAINLAERIIWCRRRCTTPADAARRVTQIDVPRAHQVFLRTRPLSSLDFSFRIGHCGVFKQVLRAQWIAKSAIFAGTECIAKMQCVDNFPRFFVNNDDWDFLT